MRMWTRSACGSRTCATGCSSSPSSRTTRRRRPRDGSNGFRWPGSNSGTNHEGGPMPIMQVSRKVDYALRAVIHLANEESSERACSVAEIAARERVPRQFLEKIVQELIHKGLVRSRRGPHGGYVLARPADQLTFRDVIEAVEGPISLNACVGDHPDCFLLGACGMERIWREGQRRVLELFETTTIADVRRPRTATGTRVNIEPAGSSKS